MEEVVFEIEAVTPMFLGGADIENGVPEFRAASIKGLLRYWYRAIYPKSFADEDRIFGSTDGRSPFRLKTEVVKPCIGEKGDDQWDRNPIAYLGYGPMQRNRDLKKTITTRKYFAPGSIFRLHFNFPARLPPQDRISILRAFWALSMLGGLGTRSRRGFGSYKIIPCHHSVPEVPPFTFSDQPAFTKALKEFVKLIKTDNYNINDNRDFPAYSCFSNKAMIACRQVPSDYHPKFKSTPQYQQGKAAMAVLEYFAYHLNNYRTAKAKTPKFIEDHDLMLNFLNGKAPSSAPRRAAFGLPHNYRFSSNGKSGNVDWMDHDGKGRRGSPLFIHVQSFSDNSACGLFTFLPAELIPAGKKLTLSGNGQKVPVPPPDFTAVEQYMDSIVKGGERIL